MPDILMCANHTCPLREDCYRNPASGTKPSEFRQSGGSFDPEVIVGKSITLTTCDHYISLWSKRKEPSHDQP